MPNLYIPGTALLISISLMIIYLSKGRIKNTETKIFSYLILGNILENIVAISVILIAYTLGTKDILYILNRIDYIIILSWAWLMFIYIFSINHKDESVFKPIFIITLIWNTIAYILILIAEVKIINDKDLMISYGSSSDIMYTVCTIYIILSLISIIRAVLGNKNRINSKKYAPLYLFIVLSVIMLILRKTNPEVLLITMALSYVDLIMFFTIENPDIKMLGEMQLARDEAEKANRAKTDFLSSMSHEIRTPLNAIKGFSEITEEAKSIEEAKENAKEVVKASNVLLEIVNGVLDISRIESGNMQIINSDYNPHQMINEIIKTINYRFEQKDLEFNVKVAEDIPNSLYGDYINIKKVITNLLTNAVKYTNEGHVDFTVNCINKGEVCRLLIAVEDTGRGIKPENIDKLFTKFNRLDEDRNTTTEGTGLGLAITKQILELMGGEITVQSVYGGGSKFSVAINQRIKTSSCVMPEVLKQVQIEQSTTQVTDYSNKKVLIIDDNKLNIKIASKFLESTKCQIYEALSAKETIERVSKGETFDLMLADDMMPNMSGTEMMKELKQKGYKKPIVVLTANVMDGEKERYLKEGFDDYLGKPINKKELERIFKRFLS